MEQFFEIVKKITIIKENRPLLSHLSHGAESRLSNVLVSPDLHLGEQLCAVALPRVQHEAHHYRDEHDQEEDHGGRYEPPLGEGVGQREGAGADAGGEEGEDGGIDGAASAGLPSPTEGGHPPRVNGFHRWRVDGGDGVHRDRSGTVATTDTIVFVSHGTRRLGSSSFSPNQYLYVPSRTCSLVVSTPAVGTRLVA